jgi:hypothetical protein
MEIGIVASSVWASGGKSAGYLLGYSVSHLRSMNGASYYTKLRLGYVLGKSTDNKVAL